MAGVQTRLLLVEDDDHTARDLAAVLGTAGYTVALAHDGPVALMLARELRPAVVLLDIGLPVLDGWELAKRIRRDATERGEPAPRFVAVTGRARPEDAARSASEGFEHHLVKPVDLDALKQILGSP